ncbi:MAG: DNA polymerase III subunit delta [Chloroflexota bacterium]
MNGSIVHVLYGTDELAIHQEIHKLIDDMGESSTAEMNITRLDGRNLNMDELNTAANAIPFLSTHRLVILANPNFAFKGAKELKNLCAIIEALPPTTTLVLAEYLDSPAKKNKSLNEWLRKLTTISNEGVKVKSQELNNPTHEELPNWIVQETKKQTGVTNKQIGIEFAAASKLADMVGENTRIAAQEIAKLLEFINYERNITVDDVEQVSIVSSQQDVFALVDALGNKDGHKAQHLLQQLLQTEDPFQLWGMVIRQFRLLLLTREIMDAGGGQDVLVRDLHLHPYVAGKLIGQGRRFDLLGLEQVYHRLLDMDEGIKTGQMSIDLAMDLLVVELSM